MQRASSPGTSPAAGNASISGSTPAVMSFSVASGELISCIPYGQTVTYGDLAGRLGGQALAKDVGAAVGRNPLCVVVPCHRVVGRDGRLTGYAGCWRARGFSWTWRSGRAAFCEVVLTATSRSAGPGRLHQVTGKQPSGVVSPTMARRCFTPPAGAVFRVLLHIKHVRAVAEGVCTSLPLVRIPAGDRSRTRTPLPARLGPGR